MQDRDDDLLDRLERGALRDALPEQPDEEIDLVAALRPTPTELEAPDLTLGGYIARHDRVPAFEGADGQPYTVDIDAEPTGDAERPYAAFLVFLRWAATGAGIMGHLESRDLTWGPTPEDARRAALDLSLYEVKAELDAAIERHRAELED